MKLISFTRQGRAGFGALKDVRAQEGRAQEVGAQKGIVNLTGKVSPRVRTIKSLIEHDLVDMASTLVDETNAEFGLSDVTFLPVIPDPAKIFCVGINYMEHKIETGRPDVEHPTIFVRYPDAQVGHLQPLIKPKETERFDYEGELAIIIGKGGRYINEENAMDHVAGYACFNDGSVRNWQRHTSQFTPGKTFPGTGGFGPYLVTADEIGDYTKLPIETRLNGEVMQKATLADLIFPIPAIINYVSTFTPLVAGDVIVTGTPGGVGDKREPPLYMEPGDLVEVDIGAVGTLVNPVVAEPTI